MTFPFRFIPVFSGGIVCFQLYLCDYWVYLDGITEPTGVFCLIRHYPVDPVNPVKKFNRQNTLFRHSPFVISIVSPVD
jgi:hypothetical protein